MKNVNKFLFLSMLVLFAGCAENTKVSVLDASLNDVEKEIQNKELNIVDLKNGDSYEIVADYLERDLYGRDLRMMAYNGSIPGPILRVKQGSEMNLKFVNNTEIENTIHSHGIRLFNEFDGVPGVTQEVVEPGASFDYRIKFPDPGFYWYHPHVREDMTQEMGLYGGFLVVPADDDYWGKVNREEYLFIDDIALDDSGLLEFDENVVTHTLMGRYGDEMLINGEEQYFLSVDQGEVVRFFVVNVANVRPFNLKIDGVEMKLVGSDGGRYSSEEVVDDLLISSSERYIFEVYFGEAGDYVLSHDSGSSNYNLGVIKVKEDVVVEDLSGAFDQLRQNDLDEVDRDLLQTAFAREPDKFLTLGIEMSMGHSMEGHGDMGGMPCHQMSDGTMMGDCGSDDGIEWEDDMKMMNAMSTDENVVWQIFDDLTGKVNSEIEWSFDQGDYVKVRIFNDPESDHPMQHPIHFHGQRFLILEEDGVKNDNLVWKDTVLIPEGEVTDVLIEMSNPGEWMAHCHIAEHLHSGMMFSFDVK